MLEGEKKRYPNIEPMEKSVRMWGLFSYKMDKEFIKKKKNFLYMKVVVPVPPTPPEFFFTFGTPLYLEKNTNPEAKGRREHKERTNVESRRNNNAQKPKEGKRHPSKHLIGINYFFILYYIILYYIKKLFTCFVWAIAL
jgi:hypothetical protein